MHPRQWGWTVPEVPEGWTVDPAAGPVVPLPPVRHAHAVPVELDVRPAPRSAPVPSPSLEPNPPSRSHRGTAAGQLALVSASTGRSTPRTEEARGSDPLTSTPPLMTSGNAGHRHVRGRPRLHLPPTSRRTPRCVAREHPCHSAEAANSSHSPGIPRSPTAPSGLNARSVPVTRSRTVRVTTTSRSPARARTRAAM